MSTAGPSAASLAVTALEGVGPARAAALARLGIANVRELLFLAPRRLERTGARRTVREAATTGDDGEVAVVGRLRSLRFFRAGRRKTVLSLDLADDTGVLRALFFNQPWLHEKLRALAVAGKTVELSGRIGSTKQGPALLAPRLVEDPPEVSVERLVPVYPATDGLGQELLRRLVGQALERASAAVVERVPAAVLARHGLPPLDAAMRALHRPESEAEFVAARRRLGFERLLRLQAKLAAARTAAAGRSARSLVLAPAERKALAAALPYTLTAGQRRVLGEILGDLARPRPMRRLLQGEVGSGKTLVALAACAAVARAGGQAAFLVPTELLGEQHFLGAAPLLERLGVRAVLVSSAIGARARAAARAELADGSAQLVFGTHALLSSDVRFARLDLCVIDEQQRFGVAQKQALLEKGADVHALLMTATPIPRTLALCYYGDLDTSLLDERPPGRGTVVTRVAAAETRAELLPFLDERARAGERVFWVCPRIDAGGAAGGAADETGADEAERESRAETASAERTHAWLSKQPLAQCGLALLHGRLSPQMRARAIADFRSGAAAVLVATSMVEVGVDVPEATVMVVEGAERFGLAQLHQLRGRVGRSARDSWCTLLATGEAIERLRFLEECSDGFALADEDLRRRGMGDLAGLRQAGENVEGLAEPELDLALVREARELVRADAELGALYLQEAASAALV